ncbi:MAG: nucleotide exchange factor GrpE [Candidatus Methanoperedenaceae archaeon]|nr:nucleotide exchange factor GrpE [Euryarchaeota archaeon]MCG2728167.1 nucleotide exchange factor GrpE [Candidatus Methanoperedenaceae archaeon]
MVQDNIEEVKKKAEKFETQYNKLKQEFKDYIETSKKNEEKKRLDIRSDISKRLLVVADSLSRITSSENASSCELMRGHTENISKNIDAVYSQVLSASGLTAIEPMAGDKFDAHEHIAIGLEFGAKYPENTVFKVVRKGYLIDNNVVRPAEVIISKSPILQQAVKPGLWDRLLRIIKPESVYLSGIKQDMDELDRKNKEKIDKLVLDIESQKERMDKIIKEIESIRIGLQENNVKPEKAREPQKQLEKFDKIPWI